MYKMILILFLFYGCTAIAQPMAKAPGDKEGVLRQYTAVMKPIAVPDTTIILNSEEDVKAQLILLALNNPEAIAADANVEIAEIARIKANSSLLSSISLGSNINEFVINNSPAANFFPKYNIGLSIPLDLFAKNRAEKRTAEATIKFYSSQKTSVGEALKAKVLKQYEIYKEKKQLLELQRITTDDDIAAYEKAQKDYKDELIKIEDVNKIYRELITSRGNIITKEKELNIAIIELEEIIGVPLKTVLEVRQQ